MVLVVLIIVFISFILSLFFEVRELYYISSFSRPDTDDEGCLYKKMEYDEKGVFKSSICRNKYHAKKFHKNDCNCPQRCRGQTYTDCAFNYENMSRTDKFFLARKLLGFLTSILGVVLTLLNILEKI